MERYYIDVERTAWLVDVFQMSEQHENSSSIIKHVL